MAKIAVNGFGRIGMLVARRILDKHPSLEIVAVNDLANESELKKIFQNDPVYGLYPKKIKAQFFQESEPVQLPWRDLDIEIVLECSGTLTEFEGAKKHLTAGAKKVIISAPSDSEEVPTYLLGVNAI
ncbi:MAG: glyceraldehyde 3-phosphate dehydrogenase N-terminal domain-containing protein, partial [Candidatus Pacebacteria bacterium]|nr:glyceraldehyde 3-phosphate dehydrogenase N-terminal domain-containing protein [Candidatus Paceibacterota bacterium]